MPDSPSELELFLRMKERCAVGTVSIQQFRENVINSYNKDEEREQVRAIWDTVFNQGFLQDPDVATENDVTKNAIVFTKCPPKPVSSQNLATTSTVASAPAPAAIQRGVASDSELATAEAGEETSAERTTKRPWPSTEPERFSAVRDVLIEHVEKNDHATAAAIQDEFARVGEKRIKEILDTLVALGVAQENNGKYSHSA